MRVGDVIDERFALERIAGRGGMGEVYRARDAVTGGPVAVKVLRETGRAEVARFAREAQVLSDLHHPRIVRYLAHGATRDGEPYLITEWLEGESLSDLLRRERRLGVPEAVGLAARAADALAAAHRRGVVHRDIKPGNIFLEGGRIEGVKVLDFGVARPGLLAPWMHTLTETGAMVGTIGYMAPEQARGEKRIDARADVFSLGCVLFACLTGKLPFEGDHKLSVLLKLVLEEAPRARELRPEVPEELDALIARMLSKDPRWRPADGAAALADLADLAGASASAGAGGGGQATRLSVPAPALTDAERRMMCVILARAPEPARGPRPLEADTLDAPTIPLRGVREPSLGEDEPSLTPGVDEGRLAARGLAIDAALASHGGERSLLADGSLLVTVAGEGAFTDQAARAARCAMLVRDSLPAAAVAVVAGRGELHARLPIGEVIERGVALLREMTRPGAGAPGLRIDEVVAGLLPATFEVRSDGDALALVQEHDAEVTRTLLGRPTPCVGRERELGLLLGLFDEVVSEPAARGARVTGPEGIGKSRLRHELIARLRARGARFELWAGRGDPMRAGAPFGLLAPALRRAAGILDGEPVAARRRKLRARVGRHVGAAEVARVAAFLGELIGAPFPEGESVLLDAARRDPLLMGDQMRLAFEDLVAAECAAQPLVLVLEDVSWGDLASLQFVDALLRNLPDAPLLVLALGRTDLDARFPGLWTGRPVVDLRLGGLTRKASERFALDVLGPSAAALAARIAERAEGNALFLEELIRAVAEGRGAALPDTVIGMIQARLDGLEPELRRALRAASVFGQVFWRGGALSLLGGAPAAAQVDRALEALARAEMIQPRSGAKFPGEREYIFRQELLREACYATLTEADRALGHRLAAAWLEQSGEGDAAVLGEHLERGGQPARAAAAYGRAATKALEGNDLAAAIAWADRALGCGRERPGAGAAAWTEEEMALHLIKLEAHNFRGEVVPVDTIAREIRARAPRGSRAWLVAAGEGGFAAARLGQLQLVEAITEDVLDLWSGPVSPALVDASARLASTLVMTGRYPLADALFARLHASGADTPDLPTRARVLRAMGRRALVRGDLGHSLRHMTAAAALCAEVGDLRRLCPLQDGVGYLYGELGVYDRAEPALLEAIALADRLGLGMSGASARHNLGHVLAMRGALVEARRVEQQAIEITVMQGDAVLAAASRVYLADILRLEGQLADAEREAAAAVDALGGAPPVRAVALAVLSRVRLEQGRIDEARRGAADAMALLEALGGVEEGEALVRLVHAEALRAAGAVDEARAAVAAAARRLHARARAIEEPELRESFLSRVPENARTLALARAWGA